MIEDAWLPARHESARIGERLRELREAAGLRLQDLERVVMCDAPTLSRIETGQAIPPPHIAERLTAWAAAQTRLQTPYSDATDAPALSPRIATPTPPRATHPVTSRRAMDSVTLETAWAIHRWIIERLTPALDGLTHEQLWRLWLDSRLEDPAGTPRASQSGLRTRVSELVRGGVVQDSGRTRTMTTGRQAIVWELADHQTNKDANHEV